MKSIMQNQDTSFDFAPWQKSRSVLNIELPPRLVEARISETLISLLELAGFSMCVEN
jgi:hypothetical protein